MQKNIAQQLQDTAKKVAEIYSDPERQYYKDAPKETFTINEIIPNSETIATVIYQKNTGKKVAVLFYYIKGYQKEGSWYYFFPTDSHILGITKFEQIKDRIEQENFKYNFNQTTEIKIIKDQEGKVIRIEDIE